MDKMIKFHFCLVGTACEWDLAHCMESTVLCYVLYLGQELAPALRDCIGEIREDYIRTCMAYIKVGTIGVPRRVGVPCYSSGSSRTNHCMKRIPILASYASLIHQFIP